MSDLVKQLENYSAKLNDDHEHDAASALSEAADRIEALEAALLPARNTLNAVRILMKNRDRREHEQRVYEAVQVCFEMMEDIFTPEQDK